MSDVCPKITEEQLNQGYKNIEQWQVVIENQNRVQAKLESFNDDLKKDKYDIKSIASVKDKKT